MRENDSNAYPSKETLQKEGGGRVEGGGVGFLKFKAEELLMPSNHLHAMQILSHDKNFRKFKYY